ncbi:MULTISPECIES: tetratricopeptide repeat protein [unclassified Pasteurella]|uniref:tetratricopeptide repeat protein n=1 Tax=unclassified Pasteurella TaxID=2621516 RepID=UPI00107332E7|nr:sel1 repeat family protein [Pasteurella sp. 19428wF3_WM03]TFU52603.1 sel1 repeat family protein [Pasteurella sp. WM03]
MKKLGLFIALWFSLFAFANEPEESAKKMTFPEIQALASQGDPEAQARLGEAYLNGNYEQKVDFSQALLWSKKAADQGNSRAKLNLGVMSLNGYQGEFDYRQAKALFEEANNAGEHKAPRYLGIIYERGLGVAQDYVLAAKFYQQGDKYGDVTAQYRLAKLYEQGLGVARDYAKAIALYQKHQHRIDHISAPSFIALGDIYGLGLGVKVNKVEAEKWYRLAIETGSKEGEIKLNLLNEG